MLSSFSALDAYFRVPSAPLRFLRAPGGLVELAAAHDGLSYPGLPYADAAKDDAADGVRLRFQCSDGEYRPAFLPLGLTHEPAGHWFGAKGGVYQALREPGQLPLPAPDELVIFEAAALASRYPFEPKDALRTVPAGLSAEYQRDLLDLVLTGLYPQRGLDYLRACGFLDAYWPELADLGTVDHSKDYHPEGDAWRHTMETFSHRKAPDHVLSLALLLHDTGKADAVSSGGKRFDRHSELGERSARAFLKRLGYGRPLQDDVAFLVRYHMLPSALPRIPPHTIEDQLSHPLFPVLLELYRCDELSTFRGPDGYYEACAAYKAWQKNARNPWRNPDGTKRPVKSRSCPAGNEASRRGHRMPGKKAE